MSVIFCLIMTVSTLKEKIKRPHLSYSLLPKCIRGNSCKVSKTMAKARSLKKRTTSLNSMVMLRIKEKYIVVEVWHVFGNVKQNTLAEETLAESQL